MGGIIGQRVHDRLLEMGKNPHWLHGKLQAKKYDGLGSRSYGAISKYVRGQGSPPQDWTAAVADELGVRVAWLYGHGSRFEEEPLAATYLFDIGRRAEETMEVAPAFWRIVHKGFPLYGQLSPVVRTVFHNAYGRHVKVGRRAEDLLPWRERAKCAVELGKTLQDDWIRNGRSTEEINPDRPPRAWTDYALARLHAMMVAMPERGSG
jgi:hypothetical protein